MIPNNNKSNFQRLKDSFSPTNLKANWMDAIKNIVKSYVLIAIASIVLTILSKPIWWIMKTIWLAL